MSDSFKVDGLSRVIKMLKNRPKMVRVGILEAENGRQGGKSGSNNAVIGAAHEFGTSKLPERSFLRVPIEDNLQKALEASGDFTRDQFEEVARSGNIAAWYDNIGKIAVEVVHEAFDSAGFGKWPPPKDGGKPLEETGQLRNSITYDIKG